MKDIKNLSAEDLFDLADEMGEVQNGMQEAPVSEEEFDGNKCPSCHRSDRIVTDFSQGIIECRNCGQVVQNVIDHNPEWRNYAGEADTSRCTTAINPLLPQSSLGTSIASTGYRPTIVQTLHSWSSMPYRERMLYSVLKDIKKKCRDNNILKCIEDDAQIMFKMVSECKHQSGENKGKYIIIRGVNRKSLIAACVFFACKKKNHTRSPYEIAKIFGLKYTEITRGFKKFLQLMRLRKSQMEFTCSAPEHFVHRYAKQLRLKTPLIEKTAQLARNVTKLNIASEHTPPSIAAALILLVIDLEGLSITKKSVSTKFRVSEVTITKAYQKIHKYLEVLMNDEAVAYMVEKMREARKQAYLDSLSESASQSQALEEEKELEMEEDLSEDLKELETEEFQLSDDLAIEEDALSEYQEMDDQLELEEEELSSCYQELLARKESVVV